MKTYAAQITPQRSTQYASLAHTLSIHELILCPFFPGLSSTEILKLGGQEYIRFNLNAPPNDPQLREWGMLSTLSAFFEWYDSFPGHTGPFLRPIDTPSNAFFPRDLVMTRRYKGKTNEMFTHFLCNIARFSSRYAQKSWKELRVLDPLAGGGTTVFTAMMLGADAAGVEKKNQDIQSTVTFFKQYMRNNKIKHNVKEERLKNLGKRWRFSIGVDKEKTCVLSAGKTVDTARLIAGFKKPHLIVTDLPYGIQHHGQLIPLLTDALPVWSSMMMPGGALTMSWESTRFPRDKMIHIVESVTGLTVLNHPPYCNFVHRVDRVIKERDILVALSNSF